MLKDHDERCRAIHDELTQDFEATVREVLDRGVEEGLVHPATTIEVLLPLLLGPVMYNSQRDVPMGDEFVEEIIDRFLVCEASRRRAQPA